MVKSPGLLPREQPLVSKVWTHWRGDNPSLSPLQNVLKLLESMGGSWPLGTHEKQLMPPWPSSVLQLLISKFKDQDWENKILVPPPKSELGEGGEFKYPKRLPGNKMGNKWRFSIPVRSMKLCKLLLQCLLLATVGIEPCLPPEAGGQTAAARESVTFRGKMFLSSCRFVVLVSLITLNVQVYPHQSGDWVYVQTWNKEALNQKWKGLLISWLWDLQLETPKLCD